MTKGTITEEAEVLTIPAMTIPAAEAEAIMLAVHEKGSGVCGVYPKEIAEFRVSLVHRRANEAGFPLRCSMEKE